MGPKDKGKTAPGAEPSSPSDQPTRPESSKGAEASENAWDTGLAHSEAAHELPKPAKKPAPKATTPGCVMCEVIGTPVIHNGHRYEIGDVAEFDLAAVAQLPGVLVSVE